MRNGRMTYPTADEAAYPFLLCERIIACVMTQVVKMGAIHIDNFQQQNELQQSTQQRRIAMGALPRGSRPRIKPLVAEDQRYENVYCDPQQQPQQIDAVLRGFPKGARITHRRLVNGEFFRGSENFQMMDEEQKSQFHDCESVEICTVGIPAEPLDFLKKAISAGHPRGIEVHVDELIQNVVREFP